MQGTNNLGGSGTSVPSTPTAKSPIFALPGAGAAPSPSESYELPAGWRKAISAKGKPYFLNDQARESSWIDPRDKYWKKATFDECVGDELPYGWEYGYDPVVGRYYIDHLRKMNVLDDPRTNAFQDQLKLVNDGISAIISSMENKKLVLGQHRDAANRLELEFAGMKGNIKAQSALQEQITAEKQAVAACEAELADLQKRVTEMRGVLVALEPSANASPAAFSSEQLDRQKKVQLEINAVEAQLEQEMEKQREIRKVLDGLRKGTGDPSASVDANADGANSTMVASTITTPVKEQPTTTLPTRQLFGTRVEREMQLIMLRKRLENERQQTERLREIAEIARKEVARAMELAALPRSQDDLRRNGRAVVPEWIQLLNAHSNKSADIRKMAKNKAESAVGLGSVMSFSEKLLFFTSSQSNLADTKNNGK